MSPSSPSQLNEQFETIEGHEVSIDASEGDGESKKSSSETHIGKSDTDSGEF